MKASQEQQNELLRLQTLDTTLGRLAHAASSLPQNVALAAMQPQLNDVRQRRNALIGQLEDARTELGRIESDVAVVEARMSRDSSRLQQTSSVKDVQALEAEIDALKKRRSDLEDIELAVMERIEGIETELATVDTERAELDERAQALKRERDDALRRIETDEHAAADDRAAVASAIEPDLLALYDKQRARYGIGAAALVRGVSLGSNVKLTPTELAAVRAAAPDDVVLCPDSGAVLVRGEDSGL